MTTHRLSQLTGAIVLALGLSTSALADDTTSSIRGNLLTQTGSAISNATIVITHEPTGTKKTFSVNESGAFLAKGLRVGGPYTVEISSQTYRSKKLENIYVTLGETLRISEVMQDDNTEVISVTGNASFFDPSKGSSSTFSGDALTKSASYNRDLKDIVKQNPLAVVGNDGSSLYLAGSNPRYNSLKVDGVNLNDDFGLAGNGYPTERSPIAFDSIDQLSVAISPFTAKEGGFSGGQISVVTKSGTNEFHGNLFIEQSKASWGGTPENPETGDDIKLNFDEESWGATFGGPIIKDKLFFFASYETFEAPSSVNKGPAGSGVANEVSNVTQADVDRVVSIAKDRYGFDAGGWNSSIPLEDEKYSLKLDWNINDDHRATFTYSHGFSNNAGNVGSGWSDELYLSSHWYNRSNEYDTYVAQLFSNWTEDFSTEFKVSTKESINGQIPLAGYDFGEVKIEHEGGLINLGPDDSRHANKLTNDTLQLRFSGEYLYEDHVISFGWEYESVDVYNIFMQHYLGSWYFESIDDFEAGVAEWFEYQNNPSLNRDDAAASFTLNNHALYIEDSFDYSDVLNLTFGLRYERITAPDAPNLNSGFVERYNMPNNENLDGKDIILPRFGFTWDVQDDLTLRGGFGLFSGGRPNVFISNAFTNDGSRIALYRTFGDQVAADTFLQNADPSSVPQHAQDIIAATQLGSGNSNIDAIDPDFNIPSTWQYSLAADYVADFSEYGLGSDWYLSAEVLYKDIKDDLIWSDLSRKIDTSKGNNGYTVEGRPIYTFADEDRDARDVLLSNTTGGSSLIETFTLAKQFDNGVNLNFSYAHSDIEDRISATGTSTNTAYEFNPVFDPENPEIGTSSFETKHRLTLNLSYSTEFFEGYKSSFHMFWERKSGRPYSWVLRTNNSTGLSGGLDLGSAFIPYIPTGADDPAVDFVNGMSYDEIISQVSAIGGPTNGGYLEKNTFRGPWSSTMDFRFEQEIPGFMEGHKGLFYFDIKNALAIFDKEGAQVYRNPYGVSTSNLFRYEINDAGQYVYTSQKR